MKVTKKDIETFVKDRKIEITFTENRKSNNHAKDILIMQLMNQEEMSPYHKIVSCKLVIQPIPTDTWLEDKSVREGPLIPWREGELFEEIV